MPSKMQARELVPCPLCTKAGIIDLHCPLCGGSGETPHATPYIKKKKRNDKARARAKRTRRPYTARDYSLIENPYLSSGEVARKLSRSIKAIENMRYKLRKEKYGRDEKTGCKSDTDIYGS